MVKPLWELFKSAQGIGFNDFRIYNMASVLGTQLSEESSLKMIQ